MENDLDAVRQLLTSAATYPESANRKIEQLSTRVDQFVFQTQRIFNQLATVAERADGRAERLEAIVQRLDRNYLEQQSQFREFQTTTNAALEGIDRVLDFLVREQGRGGS